MIKYSFYQKNPASHYVYIDMTIEDVNDGLTCLQLPAWRPGRYELGNFAKNIKRVDCYDEHKKPLVFKKTNKDRWEIETAGIKTLTVTYSYYSSELNAGACYADSNQLYINPVHCCMYVEGRRNEKHEVELKVPEDYKIASSLQQHGRLLIATDYEELADSPFIASANIQTDFYEVNGIKFYLHVIGECRPDFKTLKKDFTAFTKKQFEFWSDFPSPEYHFLFQVLPFKFYHGVEHLKSTVIAIGPGYAFNTGSTYEDVLGVSCHELFHTWNVKTIRPAEMKPYDYARENYSRTGYVYEGFTTYYGDKLLLSSGVFSLQQYFETLQERLLKHFHNYGRYNLSVAHSSWETWLDGYVPGAPYRKTNIYDEGNLVAFILDTKILEATTNSRSLRDVCILLYERFGKKELGYSEQDIIDLVNEVSGKDFSSFFTEYIYSPADFEGPILGALKYIGIEMTKQAASNASEHKFGFKAAESPGAAKVTLVAPYSPAWKAGIFAGDEIISVNGMVIKNNFHSWLNYFAGEDKILLMVNSGEQVKNLELFPDKKNMTYFFSPVLKLISKPDESQKTAFEAWKKL